MRHARCVLSVLSVLVLFYFLAPHSWFGYKPRGIKYFYEHERPEIFAEQCQYVDKPLVGEEGSLRNEKYRLRGVMIMFRHGERSPVSAVDSDFTPDCTPYHDIDRRSFYSYSKLVHSSEFKSFLNIDSSYPKYNLATHPAQCEIGQMTAEGTLQILKMGTYLHERYSSVDLFADINEASILLSSSLYTRTFQSAVAFTSAFFYVLSNLKTVSLRASPTTYFCMEKHCNCPRYNETRRLHETERVEEFVTRTSKDLFDRMQLLGEMIGMKKVTHPFELQDVMNGRYICRRNTLPCKSEDMCFTVNDYLEIIDEGAAIASRMYTKTSPASRSMYMIEAWTLLQHLANITRSVEQRPNGPTIFKIFSGHDITLAPLLDILNISYRMPPHYSSRFVFEIYEHTNSVRGALIKVIFNGKDETNNIEFCKPLVDGLCDASKFEWFANIGILHLQSLTHISNICV